MTAVAAAGCATLAALLATLANNGKQVSKLTFTIHNLQLSAQHIYTYTYTRTHTVCVYEQQRYSAARSIRSNAVNGPKKMYDYFNTKSRTTKKRRQQSEIALTMQSPPASALSLCLSAKCR